jgi:hypothetical protein
LKDQLSLGRIALFGSGETSAAGQRVFETLARDLPAPLRIAILETPAGFEPNSEQVAGRVAEFIKLHLQNYKPQVDLVPARKKETPFSPDDPAIIQPMRQAEMIFLGPGSPTYATRQLQDSLAWFTLLARHRMGADIVMASAAAIAAGAKILPVYEIYKVGEDLHWRDGLNLFGAFGLALAFVPHWNNHEGGVELDTSRCFMGQERFRQLYAQLPPTVTVVGIDEHTALIFDFTAGRCSVFGLGEATVLRSGQAQRFRAGDEFLFQELGVFRTPDLQRGIPVEVWEQVREASKHNRDILRPPEEVLMLAHQRQEARQHRNWTLADKLRDQIEALGWKISDTPDGPLLDPVDI